MCVIHHLIESYHILAYTSGAGYFVAGSVFYVTRCFLLPVFGVAAVLSVAGKAGFCVAVVFKRCCECRVFCCRVGVLRCCSGVYRCRNGVYCCYLVVLFVSKMFCVAEMVFCVAETPAGTHGGTDVTSRCFVLPDFLAVSTRVPGDRI